MQQRARRQQRIASLIGERRIASQAELLDALAEDGIAATQATLSRDLRDLGVVKGPGGYALLGRAHEALEVAGPDAGGVSTADVASAELTPRVESVVATYALSAATAGNLVVVKTGPGLAQLVALEFDRQPPHGVVGTIAGDDTVFVALKTPEGAAELASALGGVS
ncbi:MAG: arginine repressor [Planctomycetota bacterium]